MSWRLTGRAESGAVTLDEQSDIEDLGDHLLHRFECTTNTSVREITFSLTGANRLGSSQLHIGRFRLSGRVSCPASVVASVTKMSDLITDMAEVRELSTIRSGRVRVVTTSGGELLAVKLYPAGDRQATRAAFMERMQPFLVLDHPNVMRIRGLVCPTDSAGPIVLTEFSEVGSLEDVLEAVGRGSPPLFWTEEARMKIVLGLVAGIEYLHGAGVVHGELKPSDVIIEQDGSPRICGYLTSCFTNAQLTKASQGCSLAYKAPELYGTAEKDAKVDVFAFALIAFEIFMGRKVLPPSMAPAAIMRTVLNPEDRPRIAGEMPRELADLIHRCWVVDPTKRPSSDEIQDEMSQIGIAWLPDVKPEMTTAGS